MTATTVYARYNCGNTWPVAGYTGVTSGDGTASVCSLWNNTGSKTTISPVPSTFPNDVLADHLWPTSAQNPLTLTIPVSGYSTCTVVMGFAEIYDFSPTQTGSRVFDISINGSLVQNDYDVYDAVGAMNKEATLTFEDVAVVGGNVTLTLTRQVAASMISGVIILVDDPPSVSIASPSDTATVSGTVTIEATATDDDAVSDVEFFVDDVSIGSDSTPSGSTYSISWDTTGESNGSHTIKAVATDSGTQTDEDSITVTVSNAADAPGDVDPATWEDWSFEVDTGAGYVVMETGGEPDLWDTVEINRGLQGVGYKDRVARIGVLSCMLDNRGQKYSPGHANALVGFDVDAKCRFRVYFDGTWYTCFTGVLDEIRPAYGAWGDRLTRIRAVDDMDRFERAKVGAQVIQVFWHTGEGIEELADNVYTPPAKAIDTGRSQLDYIGFQASERVRSAITKLVNSEGFPAAFYTRGDGTVVFEDRDARRRITETAWTLTGPDMAGLDVVRLRRDLYNLVQVTIHPSVTNPGFEEVGSLASGSSVPMIAPGETRVFDIRYRDPDDVLVRQFLATNIQNLANGSDIKLYDAPIGGNDLYSSCTIVHKKGANSSEVTITNNSALNVYVQRLVPRGQGVRMYEDQTQRAEASTTVEATLDLGAGFNSNINEAINLAERVARRAETAKGKITDLYVKPRNPMLLKLIIGGEISDRVSLNEGQTATYDLVLINAMRQSFRAGGYAEAHFETEPETDNRPWLLGVEGRSELGVTTYLG